MPGVGVDNINIPAATARGIVVVNAPEGNTIAATEHTIGMMLAMTVISHRRTILFRKGNGTAKALPVFRYMAKPWVSLV